MDINQENDKMAQFGQMATGLGYDPQEVSSFLKLATMGEESKARKEEEKRKQELQDYTNKLTIQKKIEQQFTNNDETLSDLVKTRQSLKDAGLDTSMVDSKIQSMGVDTTVKPVTEQNQQAIDLVDEILSRDTKPLTGYLKLGGIPGMGRKEVTTTRAKIEQLKGVLQLAQAGKLKGQGQISEKERELLAKAATSLDYNMSDTDFRKELNNIKSILGGSTASTNRSAEDIINSYWK